MSQVFYQQLDDLYIVSEYETVSPHQLKFNEGVLPIPDGEVHLGPNPTVHVDIQVEKGEMTYSDIHHVLKEDGTLVIELEIQIELEDTA